MKHNSRLRERLSGYRHLPFIAYLLFAVAFLGIQMFQGLSYLDIGFYMSGYQHFKDDPVTVYFLGQWLMTFLSMSVLCGLLSVNSYMGLRIMHLTFIGIPFLAILISHRQDAFMPAMRQLACFFAGVTGGVLATMAAIHAAGMTDVMLLTIKDLTHIGGNMDDPHSMAHIIINIYSIYKEEIKGGALAVIAVAAACIVLSRTHRFRKPAVAAISLLVIINIYYWEPVANITVGICLAALAASLVFNVADTGLKCLFILSLYIPIVFPIGSNAQVEFFGKDICFMSLPLAISIICNGRSLLRRDMRHAYGKALTICYISTCIGFVFTNIKRPMMEEGNRLQCRYTIDSPLTRGILTTRENADIHNRLINNVKPLIPDGSYMICSFSTTAISLLDCKPYAVFSTVFTSDNMNKRYIDTAYRHTGRLPFLQTEREGANEKDLYVEKCLNGISPYNVIWQDERFVLKAPVNTKN